MLEPKSFLEMVTDGTCAVGNNSVVNVKRLNGLESLILTALILLLLFGLKLTKSRSDLELVPTRRVIMNFTDTVGTGWFCW